MSTAETHYVTESGVVPCTIIDREGDRRARIVYTPIDATKRVVQWVPARQLIQAGEG